MDMFDAIRESTQEESPAKDFENLIETRWWFHRNWIEGKREVEVVGEHAGHRVAQRHVVQLWEGLNNSEGFTLVS